MPQIKVNNHYIGLDSHNNMIYPGVYEAGDPLLYGREDDLVAIGYAAWLPDSDSQTLVVEDGEPGAETIEDGSPDTVGEDDLDAVVESATRRFEGFTNQYLKELAAANSVDLGSARTKPEVIAKLIEAGVEPPEWEGEA